MGEKALKKGKRKRKEAECNENVEIFKAKEEPLKVQGSQQRRPEFVHSQYPTVGRVAGGLGVI